MVGEFTSGNVYGASATRDGYTITPEVETFDGPRSDINFTAVKNTIPKITDLSLDKSSATFSIANTVTATINTENVPDGTPFLIRMVNLQGGTVICPISYSDNEEYGDLRKVIKDGMISNNQGTGTLTLLVGYESIPAGLYQICAQVVGSSVIVSKPFTILNEGSSAQIQSAEITPNTTFHGLLQTVNVSVKTLNVPDSTKISAVLTDSLGNRYNPEVSTANKVVIGNQAEFSMNIPEVPAGSYYIQVTINTPVPITVNLAYTIKPYTVTFKNYDGKTVKLAQAEYLKAVEAPENPLRAGYTFTGWDKSFNKVTSDMTVTAKYQINRYTVSFNTGEVRSAARR
ncbi:MAG: InlB B-repeat-containing protein [Anaerotignum sp.]|nr:InlB B-repeat-containing protein [Anaerotignum sp.]